MSSDTAVFEALNQALFRAANSVFSTMANMGITEIDAEGIEYDKGMSSIVGFGGRVSGFVAIHLPASVACAVATGMLGMDMHELDDVVRDAIGEVGNMVTGTLKKSMSEEFQLTPIQISIPTVVIGRSYTTSGPTGSQSTVLGAMSDDHRFKLQLVVDGL